MARERGTFMGPRLRRLRRELGLTQAVMAEDLEISASYIALMERNQRPMTADMLLRLAQTYRLDIASLAGDRGDETKARLKSIFADPIFEDLELAPLEIEDIAGNFPATADALMLLYTAYREGQIALADESEGAQGAAVPSPVAEARRFLSARRNSFPDLDEAAEVIAQRIEGSEGLKSYLESRHGYSVRRLPPDIMVGSMRRLDHHRNELVLDESLDRASQTFQIALQIVYLELGQAIDDALGEGGFATENGHRLTRRALANYAAGAIMMPYRPFVQAAEKRGYDIELLARQFGTSFEQTAHRLTTLQKPGQEGVPFFFIRVDAAGNVSKRLDGAGFPFAGHGGACPLWSLYKTFLTPRQILTEWVILPDGEKFFSIARTVTAGGGTFGAPRVERAIALGCKAKYADRLVYAQKNEAVGAVQGSAGAPTPIGVSCRLCHRMDCIARAEPPLGRQVLSDDFRRPTTPYGFTTD